MKSVGIDIGSHAIKVVEIDSTAKGFAISRCHYFPLSQRPSQDQELEIIEILRGLVAGYDPTQTRYVASLRQDQVTIRHKIFPFTEKLKITKSLPLELEDDLPFDSSQLVFDFKTVAHRGPTAEVLACAVPLHHIEAKLALLKDSAIDPEIISVEGTAYANLLENWRQPPVNWPLLPDLGETAQENPEPARMLNVLLHIGFSRTLVCAFENDHLVSVRSIYWGAKNIAEGIARKYELPLLEALKEMELKAFILLQKQNASFEAKIFSDTIAKSVRDLVKDLQISLLAIKSELNAEVKQIGLTGGPASIQGLGAFMTQFLEVPVNKFNPWDRYPQTQFERDSRLEPMMAVALGLAIEGLKKPRNPAVNFLKGPFAKQNTKVKKFFQKWRLGLQFAAAAVVLVFAWSFVRETLAEELAGKSQEALVTQAKTVANLTKKQANENGVRQYIREKKKVISEAKSLTQVIGMNSAVEVLKKVSDGLPGRTEVTLDVLRFTVQDAQVTLEGYVNNVIERELIKSRLSGLAVNKKVNEPRNALTNMPGKISFIYSIEVDRNILKK